MHCRGFVCVRELWWGACPQPINILVQSPSYDLRSLLGGTSNMLDGVIRTASRSLTMLLTAMPILPLASSSRARAASVMRSLSVSDMMYEIVNECSESLVDAGFGVMCCMPVSCLQLRCAARWR